MKRDYTVYPSMIDAQPGIVWFYNNTEKISVFNETSPLGVQADRCDDLSICVWYLSPVWEFNDSMKTKYSLLGEINKWTSVSRQRFLSIEKNAENTETRIVIQGVKDEIVSIGISHSIFKSLIVKCLISNENGQGNVIITPSNVTCS